MSPLAAEPPRIEPLTPRAGVARSLRLKESGGIAKTLSEEEIERLPNRLHSLTISSRVESTAGFGGP